MDAPDGNLLEQLQGAILVQVAEDRIVLPALPGVVVKALGLLRQPDFDLAAVARALEPDPGVAAGLLRLVNSAAFRGSQATSTILQAVTRLGAHELRTFLLEMSAQRVFASQDPAINKACRRLWEHAVGAALLARGIAEQMDWRGTEAGEDAPETAYLVGLLHDVGKPVMAGLLLDAEKRLRGKQTRSWLTPEIWIQLVAGSHRALGLAVARRWQLPAPVIAGMESAAAYDVNVPLTVANVVVLANALAKREGLCVGEIDADAIAEQVEIGRTVFLLSNETVTQICADLSERVKGRLG